MGTTIKESAIAISMKLASLIFMTVNLIYDYTTYPFYFAYYQPWKVKKYNQKNQARRETRKDCIILHSQQKPSEINFEMWKNGLSTMDKIFDYICKEHGNGECLGTRDILAEENEVQPDGNVLKKLVLGKYKYRTFQDMFIEVSFLCQALKRIGLNPKDKIVIFAETRAEWILTAFACFKSNITVVTIYANLGLDGIAHAINETKAAFVVCSEDTILKLALVIGNCPNIKNIIAFESLIDGQLRLTKAIRDSHHLINIYGYKDLLKMGNITMPELHPPNANDVAVIMYTSGTTGNPKGVLLSHKNLVAAIEGLINITDFQSTDRYIAFLPLAHIIELLSEICCLLLGMKVGFSSPFTLTDMSSKVKAGSLGDASIFKPTLVCAVPLIMERIYKTIMAKVDAHGWAAKAIFQYFVEYKSSWQDRGFDTPLLNMILFGKFSNILGGKVRRMLLGGAPLSPDTQSLTRTCLGTPIIQGYAMTETTNCGTIPSFHDRSTGRVGPPLMNCLIKIVNWEEGGYFITDKPCPRGEIHIGGRNVSKGYFLNKDKTQEEFYEEDGVQWIKSGDIGQVDADGVLRMIDRKKDLVKLQHGEYISYGKIESTLKTSPLVENICIYADPRKTYCVAIIIPSILALANMSSQEPDQAINQKDVHINFAQSLESYGLAMGLIRVECPKIVLLTLDEWTPENGLVTAALKLRRQFIYKKYQDELTNLYLDSE